MSAARNFIDNSAEYEQMTDRQISDAVCSNVTSAAVLSSRGFGYCQYDENCRKLYAEACRRGKNTCMSKVTRRRRRD